ncbi:SAS complex, SAS5 subunit/transcription initiation factor IID, subunit 14 [Saitoella complicata NRRL Y-17804]|nr:SAS complex, SAS5 subunit/transcription initiation factor IID, subunit 14 [Saitoella complicata NRRL Y-17804]ODQ54389.1 SAS complex, SAS5 subunit/transcription initiation factor IID, subunit 14 [Saitoella complicata NRRL Y-17804]
MSEVKRTVKFITSSSILKNRKPAAEGFPMRKWSIRIMCEDAHGRDVPATFLERVTYTLHPTFAEPIRKLDQAPFLIEEEGWGEFDISVTLHYAGGAGEKVIPHDLHFQAPKYEKKHVLTFNNPRSSFARILAETGPVPGQAPGGRADDDYSLKKEKRKLEGHENAKKKSKSDRPVNMEKLAAGLEKLGEEDLLNVVSMVNDAKTDDMYVKNDVEKGEFHLDLYTLPDDLLRKLWDFTKACVNAAATA